MAAPFVPAFWQALADYQVQFPSANSMGEGTPPAAWKAEYDRIRKAGFDPVLLTATSNEGASGSGQRNFAQTVRADALHCRRYDLDNTYVLPVHLTAYPSAKAALAKAGYRRGLTLRFGQ